MIGLIFMLLVSVVGLALPFIKFDFFAWVTNLFDLDKIATFELILWIAGIVVAAVLVTIRVVLAAKAAARSMETAQAKKMTVVACVLYGLLLLPAVLLVKSLMIVGTGSIGNFWILFLFATLDAIVFVSTAGKLNAKAEVIDREALDEANAIA